MARTGQRGLISLFCPHGFRCRVVQPVLDNAPLKLAVLESQMLLSPRQAAYVGDAVFELLVRQWACQHTADSTEALHQWGVQWVCAAAQAQLLAALVPHLTEEEATWAKRGRNLPVPRQRKAQQQVYRAATALEVLVGWWFTCQPERLNLLYQTLVSLQLTEDDTQA